MQERKYLLSIEELLAANCPEAFKERCIAWLDEGRRQRITHLKEGRKCAECIGAGVLIQLAVWEAENSRQWDAREQNGICRLTVTEALTLLEKSCGCTQPIEYIYGEKGKPFFKNYPYQFNLSHSGEYIFCVISGQEVGVDIQLRSPLKSNRVAQRFFSEDEKAELERAETREEKEKLFYRLWTGKEAYGKLTGEGVVPVLGRNVSVPPVTFEEYEFENYQIAVCKWKQE